MVDPGKSPRNVTAEAKRVDWIPRQMPRKSQSGALYCHKKGKNVTGSAKIREIARGQMAYATVETIGRI